MTDYIYLLFGRGGIGKTLMASEWPDSLLFSCEKVSKGLRAHDFNTDNGGPGCASWPIFLHGIDLLERTDRFRTVVIDTIDSSYRHCIDFVCDREQIDAPDDVGWGKGWGKIWKEYNSAINRILATDRGIVFTSHIREAEITSATGAKFTRIMPSMPGGAWRMVEAIADFVFYFEYFKDLHGNKIRAILTEGDELVEAKRAIELPRLIPIAKGKGFKTLQRAFKGEDVGLELSEVRSLAGKTPKPTHQLLTKER